MLLYQSAGDRPEIACELGFRQVLAGSVRELLYRIFDAPGIRLREVAVRRITQFPAEASFAPWI